MKSIKEFFPLLSSPHRVVITFHQKPDGDAMGSALGLYHFLIQLGHEVSVISPTNWANFLKWMPGVNQVIDFDSKREEAIKILQNTDWLFCLDFNVMSRTRNMEPVLTNLNCTKILIDHHEQPQVEMFDYGVSNPSKSATAEMVYDFIVESGNDDKINQHVAECLYAGVMTDTGSFRFPATTSGVHLMVARLMETGMNHARIHEQLFDNFLESRFRFIGHVLSNRLNIFYEYNAALICIPHKDLARFDIKTGDTEGLVNYPLGISGIKLAALIIDRGDERKSSFRSKDGFDANSFARKYFNGGGHFNAAGGRNTESLKEVEQIFMNALKENESQLNSQ